MIKIERKPKKARKSGGSAVSDSELAFFWKPKKYYWICPNYLSRASLKLSASARCVLWYLIRSRV